MLFTQAVTVHPELVEGCVATPFMLRQAQHERLSLQRPYNYGLISNSINNLRLFSGSSGWKGNRNILRPGGEFRPWRDRIARENPDSGVVAWVPQGTCPRPPFGIPNPGSGPDNQRIFQPGPMNGIAPHSVPPWMGRTPRPRRIPPGSEYNVRWKICRNHPLDWGKTLFKLRFIRIALGESLLNAHICPHERNGIPNIFGPEFPPSLNRLGQILRR